MKKYQTLCLGGLLTMILLSINQTGSGQQLSPQAPASPRMEIQKLEQGNPLERELTSNATHGYEIGLETGQFLRAVVEQRSISVIVRVFSPNGEKITEVVSSQGNALVSLEAKTNGVYRLEVSAAYEKAGTGRYVIRIEELLTAAQYKVRQDEERTKSETVVAWLRERAIPLHSITAGSGFADMQPLKRILKDVRVIGLGEATHGTREFFQFKHRMFEFLVREIGFRVFAIEASYAACFNINDYVMGRADDGAKALDSQGFWTWNTEEVRAMIDWMRAYNRSVPADRKVKFVGFDIQKNDRGKREILTFLKKVAPDRIANAEALFKVDLEKIVSERFEGAYSNDKPKLKDALAIISEALGKYNELLGFLVLNEARFSSRTSQAEFEQIREYARVLAQYANSYGNPKLGGYLRDYFMAENLKRLVEAEKPGTRFVLWAHNGHISTPDAGEKNLVLGNYMRRFYGDAYYALGFSFNEGSFQARDANPQAEKRLALTAYTVSAASQGSIDWYLSQTGIKNFIVNLRPAAQVESVAEWLTTPHPMRSIGSMYWERYSSFSPTTLKPGFDGLIFFEKTTRARPNPSVVNAYIK